jgi:membrane-associated phospholipid phosphatase
MLVSRLPADHISRTVLGRSRRWSPRPSVRTKRVPVWGVRWPLLAVLPAVVVVVRKRRDMALPRMLSNALAAVAPATVAAALPRGRVRNAVLWAVHMWAYKVAFEIPYDRPQSLRRRLRVQPPLRVDNALGCGVPPSRRLQQALRHKDRVNWLDRTLTAIYAIWEVEPHLALALVLAKRPDRFAAAALRQGATFDLTLIGYWLLPTAPPWWASEKEGLMDGDVQRVPTRVVRDLRGEPLEQDDEQGSNPWAAMPSDHFAAALAAACTLRELSPAAGAAGLGYALLLAFALVYLGEHYVADLVAGAALAAGVAASAPAFAPVARRADELWRRLEP